MKDRPLVLPPLTTTATGGTWGGGLYWSTTGIIIDGTYVFPPPQPEYIPEENIELNDFMIFRSTGLDTFSFELNVIDKAVAREDSLGALGDIWGVVVSERSWVGEYHMVNDEYFKNKIVGFSLADSLQQLNKVTASDAFRGVTESEMRYSTAYRLDTAMLSGDVFTPVKAFGHYVWGNGQSLRVDINSIGLNVTPIELPLLKNMIETVREAGTYRLVEERVAYDTGKDSIIAGNYLGNITLAVEGDFVRLENGEWSYTGSARAYNDIYDFNASDRPFFKEMMTAVGRAQQGKSFQIEMPGEYEIKLVGIGMVAEQ